MGRVEISIDEYFVAHLAPEHYVILAGHPRIDGEVVVDDRVALRARDQGRMGSGVEASLELTLDDSVSRVRVFAPESAGTRPAWPS
jgi:hypothetical protein